MSFTNTPIWSGLTPEEHEFQYNPQKAVPDFGQFRLHREPANADALQTLTREANVQYGEHPLRKLDIYPAGAGDRLSPVHIYLHGGYWRAQDKENFAFVAGALVPFGTTVVVANYELCPASTLDEVADSALAMMRWTVANIRRFGGDPERVTLSGHSAGAHLGAEIIAHDWVGEGLTNDILKGATLISGIYDPRPAMKTSVNAELNLTDAIAERRDVEARPPRLKCPVALLAGGQEPWHWIDQTYRYSHHLHRNGFDPAVHILPGFNHFNILDEYLEPQSQTMNAIRAHIAAA